MKQHRNPNKQFMIINSILAVAVIAIVLLFLYASMRILQKGKGEFQYTETYSFSLDKGFIGDSISIFVNDSLIFNQTILTEPHVVKVKRFAEQSTLMIVDNRTDIVTTIAIAKPTKKEEAYHFEKIGNEIKCLSLPHHYQ